MSDSQNVKTKKGMSIGAKLVLIISILFFIFIGGICFFSSRSMSDELSATSESNNYTLALQAADSTENELKVKRANVSLMLEMLNIASSQSALQARQTISYFFERNADIAAVIVPNSKELINSTFFISNEIETSLVKTYLDAHQDEINRTIKGETFVLNATPVFEVSSFAFMFPWHEDGLEQAVIIIFSTDTLLEAFPKQAASNTFLVNHNGDLLISTDYDLLKAGTNLSTHPMYSLMNESDSDSKQLSYTDESGKQFGSYKKIPIGNIAVISTVIYEQALATVNRITWQNIYIALAGLFLAILFVGIYSKSLSNPLKSLTQVSQEINKGNFNTEYFDELKYKHNDELGILIQSTKNEREILNTVSRLTNKGVAQAVVRKEIDFEPHLKDITIFFSDIRGFTAISDGFNKRYKEKSAAEIISFLNDYMSRMVNCITIAGGTVDKFEGDAIMACWGVLRDEDLNTTEHKKHVREDAINAIRGTLAMRYSLMSYNKEAKLFNDAHANEPNAKYKPYIRIGSGLNSGRATVGFMGSYDKMEFTSIGDAVNLASRTESSNKPCGTDMLITEDTYNLLKYDYIKCPENNYTIRPENAKNEVIVEVIPVTFEVKGKGKQHFYGVVNMPHFDIQEFFRTTNPDFKVDSFCERTIGPKGPKTLAEVRALLGIPTPNFSGVNLDAEENKVKVN